MRKKHIIMIIIVFTFSLLLMGCNDMQIKENNDLLDNLETNKDKIVVDNIKVEELEGEIDELKILNQELMEKLEKLNQPGHEQNLMYSSLQVMESIKQKDFQALSDYIHPSKGVRFSPYFFIDIQNDQVLTSEDILNIDQNNNIFTWGSFDGSGEPIELNFSDYYNKFIYDEDFINPDIIGINNVIRLGNMMDNVASEYPAGEFTEYHFTGFDPEYAELDWRSLRLIFEEDGGIWYLVGIAHGEWTI